jgi:hypothetical protein
MHVYIKTLKNGKNYLIFRRSNKSNAIHEKPVLKIQKTQIIALSCILPLD